MDRRSEPRSPEAADETAPPDGTAAPLDPADADADALLPPIPEGDPDWDAYVKRKIQESLDDPRPDIPADEAFAQVDRHIAEYKAKRGL
ncbi:MAG: hypothetical protein QOJ94_2340 [Sphingomonadales bacterium]|jgi:hypothetical protein|nr:hypothetical protein [Sphingomonadales bacterium]